MFRSTKYLNILLALVPYTAIVGTATLPTWRIVNLLFVALGLISIKYTRPSPSLRNIIILQITFLIYAVFQVLNIPFPLFVSLYEISFLISLLLLFTFSWQLYQYFTSSLTQFIQVMTVSITVLFIYQVFQELTYLAGQYRLTILLNETGVMQSSNFFRAVGPFLGAPGFMAESGHVALFVGPLIMIALSVQHYKIIPVSKLFFISAFGSLAISLSGGAFIHLAFIGMTLIILNGRRITRSTIISGLAIAAVGLIIVFSGEYFNLIVYRIESLFTGNSSRMRGIQSYLDVWHKYPLLGLVPKSSRFIDADPNVFIPVMLADHGLIGLCLFMIMYFTPIVLVFVNSKSKIFIIPFISSTLHLFLAYGTYTWPFVWINYILCLYLLANSQALVGSSPIISNRNTLH
jgi:hypothetical protein